MFIFEYFERLEIVNSNFILLSILFILSPSLGKFSFHCKTGNLSSSSGFQGILEVVVLLSSLFLLFLRQEALIFPKSHFLVWLFLLIQSNMTNTFADTMNWKSSIRRVWKQVHVHGEGVTNFTAGLTCFLKRKEKKLLIFQTGAHLLVR